jgi:AraC family transcriptional regulator of adaptative response/methylated-DNA-[protein]-cysteine methyltransferase
VGATALRRAFERELGTTPRRYAEAKRIERFKECVKEGRDVTDAIYDAGFGSSSRLYEKSDSRLGMTPNGYRRGGRGERIDYTIAPSPVGRLLVAATERGLAAVTLGDDDESLAAALREEFPEAEILEASDVSGIASLAAAILAHLEGERPSLDLPLDVRATAFQARVWEELRRIPYGETRTYGDVARAIGRPTATRAVARACAANPVALVTPCHRVVGADGAPTGYRWGVDRKRWLLEREQERAAGV